VEGLFEGSLTGRFQMQGSSQGPQISGDARWHGARFGTAVADDVALTCRTEEGILHVDLGISHEGLSGFVADAQIDLERWVAQPDGLLRDPHHRASLRAEDVDLGWLIPRASARRLGRIEAVLGRATGEVDIRGSENGPRINGRLRIRKGEIRLGLVDEPIGPIQAALLFDNDELRVERIRIGSRKGAAFVRGRYRWASGNTPDEVDLNAHFKKFALTHFPLLDAQVDGNVDLTGSLSTLNAQGDLALSRVQISLPAPEDPLFREVRILGLEGNDALATEGPAPREPSAYETMRAQIALDVRPGAKIRERGANLEAEGQVLLRKKRLSPTVLQGSLQTTGGTYTFLGRTFDVEKGVVTFEERLPPDPELRIVATRHIGDVTVSVRRTGTWSNPSSRLTSEPEMDETEILSYLVFNKPRKEITAEDDAQLNAAAAQLAGNLALAELSRLLASDLPISEISMEMGEDMTLTSVGVETNVGEDIILRYDRALQDGMGDRFTVEWRFWKDFSLRSEYADGGTSGLDLFWSYEY
ncbi:MAG: translocation/assembly module TamB, partial [bacterium]|nr:translocation/assembly module TamB [bacterium]